MGTPNTRIVEWGILMVLFPMHTLLMIPNPNMSDFGVAEDSTHKISKRNVAIYLNGAEEEQLIELEQFIDPSGALKNATQRCSGADKETE